ncbi:hypothetical protein ROZALSC1DRAFT_28292, partial [Rozella allomycis CSF55]
MVSADRDLDAGDVIPGFKLRRRTLERVGRELDSAESLESDDDEVTCTWSECNEVFHEDHLFLVRYAETHIHKKTIKPAHIFYG